MFSMVSIRATWNPHNLYENVCEREPETERVGSQKEVLTKPRYTHKSLSVACLALVFYSYALCWQNKMTAEFLQWKIWCLFCFLHLPPSFPYSVYLYITLSPHNFVLSPSSPFFAFFLGLPYVLLPCLFISAAYLCDHFLCSFFFIFTSMSLSFAFGHFLYLLYRFLLLLCHSSLPITGLLFEVKLTLSFNCLGSVRHFNVTERRLIFSLKLHLFN